MCIVSHDVILEVAKGNSDFVISTDRTADYPTIFVQHVLIGRPQSCFLRHPATLCNDESLCSQEDCRSIT
jgi:hypothetical protein